MTVHFAIWSLAAASVAAGLVAGVFLAFSDFLMRSLRAAPPGAGVEAMQIVNREVYRSVFMVLLIGMVPVSLAIAAYGLLAPASAVAGVLTTGGALYVVGVFLVTGMRNVPMNRRLERLAAGGAAARAYWPGYVRGWLFWNHLRSAASFGAAACYLAGAVLLAQAG